MHSNVGALLLNCGECLDFRVATLRPARDGKVIDRVKNA
jgi:hypothetical protein